MKVQTQHIGFSIPAHKKESHVACMKDFFATYPEIYAKISTTHTTHGIFLSIHFTTRDKEKLAIVLHKILKYMLIQIKLEDLSRQNFITSYDIVFVRNAFLVSLDNGLPLTYEQIQNLIEGKSPTLIH